MWKTHGFLLGDGIDGSMVWCCTCIFKRLQEGNLSYTINLTVLMAWNIHDNSWNLEIPRLAEHECPVHTQHDTLHYVSGCLKVFVHIVNVISNDWAIPGVLWKRYLHILFDMQHSGQNMIFHIGGWSSIQFHRHLYTHGVWIPIPCDVRA